MLPVITNSGSQDTRFLARGQKLSQKDMDSASLSARALRGDGSKLVLRTLLHSFREAGGPNMPSSAPLFLRNVSSHGKDHLNSRTSFT